jgi:Flp pilus assembly protein TadB
MQTIKENAVHWMFVLTCASLLVVVYAFMLHKISKARSEIVTLKESLVEAEERASSTYIDFCICSRWLQECQLDIQSIDTADLISVEAVNEVLRIKR